LFTGWIRRGADKQVLGPRDSVCISNPSPIAQATSGSGGEFEGFELLAEIGAGSFARVFEARRAGEVRSIALKISRYPVVDRDVAVRAQREVRILESLRNPHVVRIYDYGVGSDARWYMVMELLAGADLSQLHDSRAPMDPLRACKLMLGACRGLAEAHERGIVHRDVKPENLWIEPDGTCKVLDFGLARAWDPNSSLGITVTSRHTMVGTPHYAQPEQLRGAPLVAASDVYSLGTILYELLSARMPLVADESLLSVRERLRHEPYTWLSAHLDCPVVPLHRYDDCRRRLPERLMSLVHRMLAKQPEHRPESAGAVARELEAILADELSRPQAIELDEPERERKPIHGSIRALLRKLRRRR
jgi:serine/threonine protein kinase